MKTLTYRQIRYRCPDCGRTEEVERWSDQPENPPTCGCGQKMVANPRQFSKADWFGPLGKPPKAWVEEAHEGCELENQLGR